MHYSLTMVFLCQWYWYTYSAFSSFSPRAVRIILTELFIIRILLLIIVCSTDYNYWTRRNVLGILYTYVHFSSFRHCYMCYFYILKYIYLRESETFFNYWISYSIISSDKLINVCPLRKFTLHPLSFTFCKLIWLKGNGEMVR